MARFLSHGIREQPWAYHLLTPPLENCLCGVRTLLVLRRTLNSQLPRGLLVENSVSFAALSQNEEVLRSPRNPRNRKLRRSYPRAGVPGL